MTWKPHATVAAIIEKDNRFLMVEENIEGKILYNQPAGHLEPDESIIDAAIRETCEETAWQFYPEALVGVYVWKQEEKDITFLRFAICGQCSNHNPEQKLDDGILKAVWMSKEELESKSDQLRSPLVLKCIDDYLANSRQPLEVLQWVK